MVKELTEFNKEFTKAPILEWRESHYTSEVVVIV